MSIARRTVTRPTTTEAIIYVRGTDSDDINERVRDCLQYCQQELDHRWFDERHVKRAHTDTWRVGTGADRGSVLTARARSENSRIRIERDWSRQSQQTGRRRTLDEIDRLTNDLNRMVDLVIPSVNTAARTHKHIDELIELLEAECKIHVVRNGFSLHRANQPTREILELGAGLYTRTERPDPVAPPRPDEDVELEFVDPTAPAPDDVVTLSTGSADQDTLLSGIKVPVRVPYSGGRPPLGFDVEGDDLVSNARYVTINTVVQKYRDGDLSKSEAAEKLDVARSTIENLSSRAELYQLV